MLNLKKYANGRYYDTDNKKYVLKDDLSAMIRRGRKVRVVLARSGEEITETVVADLGGKPRGKGRAFSPAGELKNWVRESRKRLNEEIDGRIDRILEAMNLPTRQQVVQLTAGITALTDKIRDLEKIQARRAVEADEAASAVPADEPAPAHLDHAAGTPAAEAPVN